MPAPHSSSAAAAGPTPTLPRIFDLFLQTTDSAKKTAAEIDDDLMVEFFIRWNRYGGGPEEHIMTTFGITKSIYLERLRTLARSDRINRYPLDIARALNTLAIKEVRKK